MFVTFGPGDYVSVHFWANFQISLAKLVIFSPGDKD